MICKPNALLAGRVVNYERRKCLLSFDKETIALLTMLKQVWAFTMIVGERTRNSSTRGIVQQQIWQICYGFIIDTRLYYPLEEEVILSWN